MPTKDDNAQGKTVKHFARNLYEARVAKNMSQSDLARAIWGETTDARGYPVARNRDRISVYERGKGIPNSHTLHQIAEYFGMTPEEMAPDIVAKHVEASGEPEIEMAMAEGMSQMAVLRINVLTPVHVAAQVIALLSGEGTTQPIPVYMNKSKTR